MDSESKLTPKPFATRCKFICENVVGGEDQRPNNDMVSWFFRPVNSTGDPDHENSKFWKYTPAGSLQISVSKEHYKGAHPEIGKEYFLDLVEAPPASIEAPVEVDDAVKVDSEQAEA